MASILRISSSSSPCSSSSSSSACASASASASAVSFAWLSRQSSCFRRRYSRRLCSGISVNNTSTVNSQTVKEQTSGTSIPKFQKRLRISDILNRPNDALSSFGHRLCIRGWVRTCRVQKTITFIEINDGSCLSNLQCVVNSTSEGYDKLLQMATVNGCLLFIGCRLMPMQYEEEVSNNGEFAINFNFNFNLLTSSYGWEWHQSAKKKFMNGINLQKRNS